MNTNFYVYAYVRTNGTPYYIGKGICNRAYVSGKGHRPPKDKSRIKFLRTNLEEDVAFSLEIWYIQKYGRKDILTGILINRTDGGEGQAGIIKAPLSQEVRDQISKKMTGVPKSEETKEKMRKPKSSAKKIRDRKPHTEESKQRMRDAKAKSREIRLNKLK